MTAPAVKTQKVLREMCSISICSRIEDYTLGLRLWSVQRPGT